MMFDFTTLAFCAGAVYFVALLLNTVRKNNTLITLYLVQSLLVALALASLSVTEGPRLLSAALLTFGVKCIVAPAFLFQLIRKYNPHFAAASYLSLPLTLIALATVTGFAFAIEPKIIPAGGSAAPLLLSAIFSAFFLMVNRRGALAVIVGVLALENAVVLLAAVLGAAHSFALEFTIAFDIAVWVAIATAFISMMHRQFGIADTDVRHMSHLTESDE